MQTFSKFSMPKLTLRNRIVLPPMCMNSSDESGLVKNFHRIHYGTRAYGGAGLILLEATAVESAGRITGRDLGIWDDQHIEGLSSLVQIIHEGGAQAGIQLAHAGRKCTVEQEQSVAPSSFPFSTDYMVPSELSQAGIDRCVDLFQKAAQRALKAGFDMIELHAAHGYLIHQFLSPLANRRTDAYNGSLENRMRFLKEVIQAVRLVWPADRPILVRLSASDHLPGGLTIDDTIQIVRAIRQDVDIFDISSGGLLPAAVEEKPGYQVGFAEAIRKETQVPVITVGMLTTLKQVESIIVDQQADLVALGRELLRNPYWPLLNACGQENGMDLVPHSYRRAFLIGPIE